MYIKRDQKIGIIGMKKQHRKIEIISDYELSLVFKSCYYEISKNKIIGTNLNRPNICCLCYLESKV